MIPQELDLFSLLLLIFLYIPSKNKDLHTSLSFSMEGLQRRFQSNKAPNPEDESEYLDEQGVRAKK